jgi:hypothetical protein
MSTSDKPEVTKRDRHGVATERIPGGEGATRTVRPDPNAEREADEVAAPEQPKSNGTE